MSSEKEIANMLANQDGLSLENLIKELQAKVEKETPVLDELVESEEEDIEHIILESRDSLKVDKIVEAYASVEEAEKNKTVTQEVKTTADIIKSQLQIASQVGAPEVPTGGDSITVQDRPKKKKIPLVPIPTPVPFNKVNLPAKNKSTVQEAIAKKLGIDPDALKNKAKAAEAKIAYFAKNRVKIEGERKIREAQRAQEMREQAAPLIGQMIQRRINQANEEAQTRIRRTVKRRELLGNLHVEGKVKVTREFDAHTIFRNENMEIVVYPPQYRTIQTNNRWHRLPLPWVAFNHIWYDRNNSKRMRRQLRTGTLTARPERRLSHHLFIGFSGQPLDNMDALVYQPQMPHVYENFNICLGPVPVEGELQNRQNRRRDEPRREPTTEDFIDAFWNNRFVYEERGPLHFAQWEEIPLEEILNVNWEHGRGTPLHRFPPNIRSYEDFFE